MRAVSTRNHWAACRRPAADCRTPRSGRRWEMSPGKAPVSLVPHSNGPTATVPVIGGRMTEFPRGVADEHGRRAVVHDHHGTLIALDLATGAVLWRQGRHLRPCAVLA